MLPAILLGEKTVDIKKEKPARRTFPIATIIAVLTGVSSLLIFLTGKTNLPDILKGSPAMETPTATPTVILTPTVSLDAAAEASPSETFTAIPTAIPLTAEPPSDSDLETILSIWTLTKFQELPEPGSNAYTVEVTHDSAWIWDCYFCATETTFPDFLATLEVEFRIDKVRLEEASIRIFDRPGAKGWICRHWATKLTYWPKDRSVFLEIRYAHNQKANDGRNEFAAGEYSQTIVVVVRG